MEEYNSRKKLRKYGKYLLQAVKIGIGSSIAIYIAQSLDLNYAVSAGSGI